MNIRVQKRLVKLNESEKVIKTPINTDLVEVVMRTKSKQFKFDCGAIMGRINVHIENRFGMFWHYHNNTDFESFLSSVSAFIETSNNVLTENDKGKLGLHYNKFANKASK